MQIANLIARTAWKESVVARPAFPQDARRGLTAALRKIVTRRNMLIFASQSV